MPPFFDSSAFLLDGDALRDRAHRDGYLCLREVLPAADVERVRRDILGVCDRHGWLDPEADPSTGVARTGIRLREGEPEYMAAYDEIQRLEAFHSLAHAPRLLAVLGRLLAEPVLPHPRNIARVVFPQNNRFTTPAHQDYVHIQGTPETWTVWAPLGDCPEELGGLEILSGSHRLGLLPVRSAYGAGGLGVETEGLGLEWHTGPLAAGDVLLFHSHTVHRGRDNRTPDRLRLSVDYRYQPISHPITAGSLLPHFNRLPWETLYQGWQRKEVQYYWQHLPLRLVEYSRQFHESAGPLGGVAPSEADPPPRPGSQ